MMIIPNIWKNEIHVPSHQPVKDVQRCAKMFKFFNVHIFTMSDHMDGKPPTK